MTIWIVIVIAALVAAVFASELGLRVFHRRLRPLTEWLNWEMHHKIAAIDERARTGGATVVGVGASDIQAAFDPYLLTDLLHLQPPAFNAAINGSGALLLEPWTIDVVLPRLRPKVVVIGLGSHLVNRNNRVDHRYIESLWASRGWRDMKGGGSASDRIVRWFERHSWLIRYRRYLGRRRMFQDPPRRRSSTCRALGQARSLLLFRFRAYSTDERQLRIWNEVLVDYDVGPDEIAALGRLIDGIRAAGAVALPVWTPVTEGWIDVHPHGRKDYEAFKRAVASMAAEHRVELLDLSRRLDDLDNFADPVHLNGIGLRHYTEAIAEAVEKALLTSDAAARTRTIAR